MAQRYNHASLKNALRELGIDFYDGYKELVLQCFKCSGHKRPLYLNCGDRAGIMHCFRCGWVGTFECFVEGVTDWSGIRVAAFCYRHRAYDDPSDEVERKYVADVTEATLEEFNYRHPYCYERGIQEGTLRRYRVGYDRSDFTITLPWFDRVGNLAAIKKRTVTPAPKSYRFLASGKFTHCLFGLHLLRPSTICWITEAEFCTMYVDQIFHLYSLAHGAVALGGKVLHGAALEELLIKAPKLVVLALDNDDDGREALGKIKEQLAGKVPTYTFEYPTGAKDPNEVAQEHIVKQALKSETYLTTHLNKVNERYAKWQKDQQCVL